MPEQKKPRHTLRSAGRVWALLFAPIILTLILTFAASAFAQVAVGAGTCAGSAPESASPDIQAKSLSEQAVSDRQIGSSDGIIDTLRRHNIPVTRENYLDLAYMGEPPEELSAEEEVNLPPELRKLKR